MGGVCSIEVICYHLAKLQDLTLICASVFPMAAVSIFSVALQPKSGLRRLVLR
jgi:hypothetical protein